MSDGYSGYSVCSLGKQRWFWCVWESYADFCAGNLTASGYGTSKEDAEQQAAAAAGEHITPRRACHAAAIHRNLCWQKRLDRRSDATEAERLEFVYQYHGRYRGDGEYGEPYWTRYRIVKKTKQRLYVESDPYREDSQRDTTYPEETFVLDRSVLEREGSARAGRGWARKTYFLRPEIREPEPQAPPCLSALGLASACTAAEVKAAFRRKSKELHPDQGGDHESFIALRAAYEEALKLVA